MLKNKSFWIIFGLVVIFLGAYGFFITKISRIEARQTQLYKECIAQHSDISIEDARKECGWILD